MSFFARTFLKWYSVFGQAFHKKNLFDIAALHECKQLYSGVRFQSKSFRFAIHYITDKILFYKSVFNAV